MARSLFGARDTCESCKSIDVRRWMVALLLHGYASGLYSSRRIARACRERNDFVMIVALDPPDFRTISDFRKRHLKALGELFLQVLKLCETAGLVKLGHVALDGTKIKANASKHKAMSYERMKKREAELKADRATGTGGSRVPGVGGLRGRCRAMLARADVGAGASILHSRRNLGRQGRELRRITTAQVIFLC